MVIYSSMQTSDSVNAFCPIDETHRVSRYVATTNIQQPTATQDDVCTLRSFTCCAIDGPRPGPLNVNVSFSTK